MSLIAKNALIDALETYVSAATGGALEDTHIIGSEIGSLQGTADKYIRLQMKSGVMNLASEAKRQERGVAFILQCFVKPQGADEDSLDAAMDDSFEMAREAYELLEGNNLSGAVCDCTFHDGEEANYETGRANFYATPHGATYLYGVINK